MNFSKEELTLIQTALNRQLSTELTHPHLRGGDEVRKLKNRIQSLLKDDGPITLRCPESVPA